MKPYKFVFALVEYLLTQIDNNIKKRYMDKTKWHCTYIYYSASQMNQKEKYKTRLKIY